MNGLFSKITQQWNDFLFAFSDMLKAIWKFDLDAYLENLSTELEQSMCSHTNTVSIGTDDPEYHKRYLWVKCLDCKKILHCTEWFSIDDWVEGYYSNLSLKVEQYIED